MQVFSNEQIRSSYLFRGREDVFAVRWEKDSKTGYMPAYDLNWDEFAKHKLRGGTLKDFPHKQFSKLSEQRIINNLTMQAYVIIKNREHNSLSLPSDAVIRNSRGASVWIQVEGNKFKNKMMEIGLESNDRVEIKSGLKEGDIVVISGAYLLNSEYIFKIGSNPMEGMKM